MTQARLRPPVIAFFVWAACTIPWSATGKPIVTAHISNRHTEEDARSQRSRPEAECIKSRWGSPQNNTVDLSCSECRVIFQVFRLTSVYCRVVLLGLRAA